MFEAIATVVSLGLTVFVYHQQKIQADTVFNYQKARDAKSVDQQVRQFYYDNDDELEFLPLCVIVVAWQDTRMYHRRIYNSFRLLSSSVQKKIIEKNERLMSFKSASVISDDATVNDLFGPLNTDIVDISDTLVDDIKYAGERVFDMTGRLENKRLSDVGAYSEFERLLVEKYNYSEHVTATSLHDVDISLSADVTDIEPFVQLNLLIQRILNRPINRVATEPPVMTVDIYPKTTEDLWLKTLYMLNQAYWTDKYEDCSRVDK